MDSICKTSFNPNPNLLHFPVLSSRTLPRSSFSLPPKHSLFKTLTLTPIRASQNHNPNPNPKPSSSPKTLLSAVVKPAAVALTAAAAVFLSRHPKPSIAAVTTAAAPPPPQFETLTSNLDEQTLESRLSSNPKDIPALRALMELKVKNRNLPAAIAIVDRLIALEPAETDLALLKAHLQSYNGEIEAAKLGFEAILSKDPYMVEAYHGLVMMASQLEDSEELGEILERVEKAMAMCNKEKRKEELKDFKLLVAQVEVIGGKYVEALKIYEELVKEEPRDFRPYLCQGIIYTLMRKKDEAEKQFEKYRKLVPQGHPYAQYFDKNMNAIKGFSPME